MFVKKENVNHLLVNGQQKEREMIFVFGSNLAGIHGAGAAAYAMEHYDAEWGVGEGITGRAYALPTKDENIRTLPLNKIEQHMTRFLLFVGKNPILNFNLTPVGCGLAGYKRREMWLMLRSLGAQDFDNLFLSSSWIDPDVN